jgi:CheY-like chemotaxis protein
MLKIEKVMETKKALNILVVDDNPNNRLVLSFLFDDFMEELGIDISVDEAVDGVEAVELCQQSKYNMIFMDIMMPRLDGLEATKKILEMDQNSYVIFVSAMNEDEQRDTFKNSGAKKYLQKPITHDMLLTIVTDYLNISKS